MVEKNITNAAALATINRKVQEQISEAVALEEASSFPDPATVYNYIYKQPHYPFLQN